MNELPVLAMKRLEIGTAATNRVNSVFARLTTALELWGGGIATSAAGVIMLMVLTVSAALGTEVSPRTLGIVSVDAGTSGMVVDQLTAALSGDPQIRLVERETITRVLREQEVGALGLTSSARIKLGQLIGAEVLVLVGHDPTTGTNALRFLLCDSATGARIGQIQGRTPPSGVAALAGEIQGVLARFPRGVRSVVAVPDLISRDLRLEHAGLQTGLAELLRAALSREPGVALVELEEAKSIAAEHELAGGTVQRIVPLFVEGTYQTDALAAGGPQISITLSLRMAQREEVRVASGPIALNHAGEFLLSTVQAKILAMLQTSGPVGLDPEREFALLTQRAEKFAEIAEFDRSAALREAALLLRPNANEQRIRLVRDYNAAPYELVDDLIKGRRHRPDDPAWIRTVARRRESWRRGLYHVEYLIRNGCVDIELGTQMLSESIQSIYGIRATEAARLQEDENIKKEFLRHVAPALLKLPTKSGQAATTDERSSAAYRVYECIFTRLDGNHLAEDDLLLAGDLLCDLLPEETPLAMKIMYILASGGRMFGAAKCDVISEAWSRFTQRLLNSPRPLVNAYGRYAKLCEQRIRLKEANEAMLAEANALLAIAQTQPILQLDPRMDLQHAAADETRWIRAAMIASNPAPPVSILPPPKAPAIKNEPRQVFGRVRLNPLPLALAPEATSSMNTRSGKPVQSVICEGILRAWEGVDVVYSRAAVLMFSNSLAGHLVLADEQVNIRSVVFDGRYLWISRGYGRGVCAIDRNGKLVASIGSGEGLPEAQSSMPLQPLGPGRVMAAGAIKRDQRSWLATIELTETSPRVKVFHEAIKAWSASMVNSREPNRDLAIGLEPAWITEHRDQGGKQWVFVGRTRNAQPLVVDPDSLSVSIYPDYFPRTEAGFGAFWSRGGLLYVAGRNRGFGIFHFDPHSRTLSSSRAFPEGERNYYGNPFDGCIAEFEGQIYYAGSKRWLRSSITGDAEEVLIAEPHLLPQTSYPNTWRLGTLSVAGLVAWSEGRLYKVVIEPADQIQTPK